MDEIVKVRVGSRSTWIPGEKRYYLQGERIPMINHDRMPIADLFFYVPRGCIYDSNGGRFIAIDPNQKALMII